MSRIIDLFEYYGINNEPSINIVKSDNLGLVYMGSKRTIAKRIVEIIHKIHPNAYAFYDMFGGGGAMSYYAKQCGYDVLYNELDTNIYKIIEFCSHEYNENDFVKFGLYEWLSKEDFKRIREKIKSNIEISAVEAIKLLVYSFGCGFRTYAYGEYKEKLIRLAHNAIVNLCFDSLVELDNLVLSKTNYKGFFINFFDYLIKIDTIQERADAFMKYNRRLDYVIINNVKVFRVRDVFNQKTIRGRGKSNLSHLLQLSQFSRLSHLSQLLQFSRLSRLSQFSRLRLSNKSYLDVDIPHKPSECVIYCDPPYRNTGRYDVGKFNHDLFYDWCIIQAKAGYKVFISEYDMPKSDFTELWQIKKLIAMCRDNNNSKSIEKLYLCTPQ